MSHFGEFGHIVQCQRHRGVYKEEGRYADADPLYKRALASTPEQKGSTLSS